MRLARPLGLFSLQPYNTFFFEEMRMKGPNKELLPGFELLEQTPIIIEKILIAAGRDSLHWKPAENRWSISEVLAHLADVETVFLRRAKAMVEEENPRLEAYDQNAAYAAGMYSAGNAIEHLHKFCHERDRSLSWLRYLPPTAAIRRGQHSEIGPITLGQLLHEWAFHDLGHIRQISELYRAHAFYPRMGEFRRYYTVHP
jgi:hypothetical protein